MTDHSNIQGNLRLSSGINSSDTGDGRLNTDLIQEATTSSGVTVKDSKLIINTSSSAELSLVNGLGQTAGLVLNNPANSLVLSNNGGDLNIKSKGGKGINISEITGNILIDSTTDSINDTTGSVILEGGLLVKKSMNIKQEIHGLDGIHELVNTVFSENVLDIQNTNAGGYSGILFKDTAGSEKLDIGFGNSTVTAPLNDKAYIQSTGGSSLLFRGNQIDSFQINNNATIDFYNTTASTANNSGALRIQGGVGISNATDAVSSVNGGALTVGGGVAIQKKLFIGDTLNLNDIVAPVSNPGSGTKSFYIDTADSLLKSKNSSGVITTYQPTNTKGDITAHDGTSQVRLPVGTDGYVLQSDSSTATGLKWAVNTGSGQGGGNKFYLGTSVNTTINEPSIGSFFNFVYPAVDNGSSSNFFNCKSYPNLAGVSLRLNSNPSLSSSGQLTSSWPTYRGVKVLKSYSEAVGDYVINNNTSYGFTVVALSGTTWSNLSFSGLVGCFCLSVSTSSGPSATFMITKNVASQNTGNIVRLISTPGTPGGQLELRWQSSSVIQMRKTNNANDGDYRIVDNFSVVEQLINVTLTGTAQTFLTNNDFKYYTDKSFICKVVSQTVNGPYAIFAVSKNSPSINGNVYSVRSPGLTTNELLNFNWNSNSLPSISKNGTGYNGVYDVYFSKLI